MDNAQLKELVTGMVPDAIFEESKQFLTVNVSPDQLHQLMKSLKERPDTSFDYLFCITGVDIQEKLRWFITWNLRPMATRLS